MPRLIGLFGGTFDPPHIGHLILSAETSAQLGLDRLLWILTPNPPHKQGQPITPLEHRLAMVELAISDNRRFELSTVEIDRPGPHYALDTVKIISEQNPAADLVYLMGGDSLRDLPAWHHPTDLVAALCFIGVMRRPGDSIDLPALEKIIPGLAAKVRYVDAPLLDIAAHEIRQRVADGRPFRYFLPQAVYDYIVEHNLYR
ncbi:MAG: nicotinate (nicotinamide) nucleotide adenylyltransferase [Candidatus Atribacteria bacterium]|nr:nicotinate (nicotinamide) nucleotide adenylyltransferase [Candidatus Atribacteria bacterium]